MTDKQIEWIDHKREPKHAPDPRYPNGVDVDLTGGAKVACLVELPYPARRCGMYVIGCETCGQRIVVTTAGRPDDPKSVTIACRNGSKRS